MAFGRIQLRASNPSMMFSMYISNSRNKVTRIGATEKNTNHNDIKGQS